MATGNFYNKNASRIFACEINEEWEHKDLLDNLRSELSNLKYSYENFDSDNERQFTGFYVGDVWASKYYGDVECEVRVKAVVRSGYYSGCNLDWELEYRTGSDWSDELDVDEIASDIEWNSDLTEKRSKYLAEFAETFLENAGQELIEKVEKIFTDYSTPLVVTARFSNGETIYERADNPRAVLKSIVNA